MENGMPVYSTATGHVFGKTCSPDERKFVRRSSAHVRVSRSCAVVSLHAVLPTVRDLHLIGGTLGHDVGIGGDLLSDLGRRGSGRDNIRVLPPPPYPG